MRLLLLTLLAMPVSVPVEQSSRHVLVGLIVVPLVGILLTILLCPYRSSRALPCDITYRPFGTQGTNQGSDADQKTNQRGAPDDVNLPLQDVDTSIYEVLDRPDDYENGASATQQHLTHAEAAKKLLSVREPFIKGISEATLHSLLDKLLTKGVISDDEMEAATGKMLLRADKARYVIDTVRRKGNKASSEMINMIDQLDPFFGDLLQWKPAPPTE